MKKFFALTVLVFSIFSSAFAVGGRAFHGKKLSLLQTRWFDIVFDDDSLESAKKIASVADGYYLEICEKLGAEACQRFPVTVTREIESMNGFFSPAPYNLIVLYDSFAKSPNDLVSDTITSTFYHELTHAVTLNYKSKANRVFSAIFGDFFNPAAFSMSYFWIEGAAVLFESQKGEGRLNNPFFTQLVTQAKLDSLNGMRKFPSWKDVAGARDIFPGGSDRYAFGACFADYLVSTYGFEKYAELWRNAGASNLFSGLFDLAFVSASRVFKKTYGVKLNSVWRDFENSIEIPLDYESVPSELISDKISLVRAFDAVKNGEKTVLTYYDGKSGWIYLVQDEITEKLLFAEGVNQLRFSPDGEKILVTRLVSRKSEKSETGLLDVKSKKYGVVQGEKSRDGYFKVNGGKFEPHFLNLENNLNEIINTPVAIEENWQAEIVRNGTNWSVRIETPDEKLDFPSPYILQNLHFVSCDSKKIQLSLVFAEKGKNLSSISKNCIFEFDRQSGQGTFFYQKNPLKFSGSVSGVSDSFSCLKNSGEIELYFVSTEYDKNLLYRAVSSLENFEKLQVLSKKSEYSVSVENSEKLNEAKFAENSGKYQPSEKNFSLFPYYLKGLRLPVGLVPVYNTDFSKKSTALLGISYASSTPWLDNLLILSGGYDFFTKTFGTYLNLRGNDSSYSYLFSANAVFDEKGFRQTVETASFTKKLVNGLMWNLNSGISSNVFYGRDKDFRVLVTNNSEEDSAYDTKARKEGLFTVSKFNMTLSNIHKVSAETGQYAGMSIQPFVNFQYDDYRLNVFELDVSIPEEEVYLNAGLSVLARVPFILPLAFQADLFPVKDFFADAMAKIYLHTWEIQKGLPVFSLYLNRIALNASYTGYLEYESGKYWDIADSFEIAGNLTSSSYSDRISVNLNLTLSPNSGYFADPTCQLVVGCSGFYKLHSTKDSSKFGFSLSGSLNF